MLSEEHCATPPPLNDALNCPIYHNSNITFVTSLLLMSFALKHNLTDAAIQDLLQLISFFIPTPNTCITSLYSFKKFFAVTQLNSNHIYYCRRCKSTIANMLALQCSMCSELLDFKSYFISISLAEQIKKGQAFSQVYNIASVAQLDQATLQTYIYMMECSIKVFQMLVAQLDQATLQIYMMECSIKVFSQY